MAEQLVDKREATWRWDDVPPLTRSLVAIFSGSIGNDERNLSVARFKETVTEAFPKISGDIIGSAVTFLGLLV